MAIAVLFGCLVLFLVLSIPIGIALGLATAVTLATTSDIPLIMISAVLSDDEDRFLPADQRALEDRFLSKPVSPDELVAEVAGLLAAEPHRLHASEANPSPDTREPI